MLYDARRRNFHGTAVAAARHQATRQCRCTAAGGGAGDGQNRRGGVTVTEAAALPGFYWMQALKVITDGIRYAGTIMPVVAIALGFGRRMTESGIPNQLVDLAVISFGTQ
jgi:hypothetical protein